jgi:hypothetical protein
MNDENKKTKKVCSKKTCELVGIEQDLETSFSKDKKSEDGFDSVCKSCIKIQSKIYYDKNKVAINAKSKKYHADKKDEISAQKKEYYAENKEVKKQYRIDNIDSINAYTAANKDKIRKTKNKYRKNRRKNDPTYRLRKDVSKTIGAFLKKCGGSKGGQSSTKYLPYTADVLKEYIERLFSHPDNLTSDGYVWMNWNNQGIYDVKIWDDNNPDTWTWQLDHIIPQADLPHASMEDENFRKCWALDNLRPYSAKQNCLDGVNRTRHKNNTEVNQGENDDNEGNNKQRERNIKESDQTKH